MFVITELFELRRIECAKVITSTFRRDELCRCSIYIQPRNLIAITVRCWHIAQGTYLPLDVAKDFDDMATHEELHQAAHAIRERMQSLREQSATQPGERVLRRTQSLSETERHMLDFDRIVKVLMIGQSTIDLQAEGCQI